MYIFVTGTDTDVGKSYVSKGICRQLAKQGEKTAYLKPFQSGIVEGILSDSEEVSTGDPSISSLASYVTKTPSTPLISGEIDGVDFSLKKVLKDFEALKKDNENVLVEGSGGIYVPVKKGVLMIDIIKTLNLPSIVVARPDLGTINHTLMTIECLQNNGIKVLGIVVSNFPDKTEDPVILRAVEMIEMFSGDVKVLSVIKNGQKDFSDLTTAITETLTTGRFF